MNNKIAYVRTNIILLSIPYRILIYGFLFFCKDRGFGPMQFETLALLLLPLTCLYVTLIIKFIVQNRYQAEGRKLRRLYIGIGFFALLLLIVAELLLIVWKSLDTTIMEDGSFYLLVALFESGFGVYVGYYLTELFGNS